MKRELKADYAGRYVGVGQPRPNLMKRELKDREGAEEGAEARRSPESHEERIESTLRLSICPSQPITESHEERIESFNVHVKGGQ